MNAFLHERQVAPEAKLSGLKESEVVSRQGTPLRHTCAPHYPGCSGERPHEERLILVTPPADHRFMKGRY
jgi:hypothetical protein